MCGRYDTFLSAPLVVRRLGDQSLPATSYPIDIVNSFRSTLAVGKRKFYESLFWSLNPESLSTSLINFSSYGQKKRHLLGKGSVSYKIVRLKPFL